MVADGTKGGTSKFIFSCILCYSLLFLIPVCHFNLYSFFRQDTVAEKVTALEADVEQEQDVDEETMCSLVGIISGSCELGNEGHLPGGFDNNLGYGRCRGRW